MDNLSARHLIESLWVSKIRDNNNRRIHLTDVFCVLLRYKWASNFWSQYRDGCRFRKNFQDERKNCKKIKFNLTNFVLSTLDNMDFSNEKLILFFQSNNFDTL